MVVNQLRVASGIVLFAYVLCHLSNHALGIGSLPALARGHEAFQAVWSTLPALVLLYTSLLAHIGIALWSIWRRHTLRMRRWEWAQMLLGLSIPFLLAEHVIGTRAASLLYGTDPDYRMVLLVHWGAGPVPWVLQATLLIVAWVHGCLGLHYWLRTKPGYTRCAPTLLALATLIPGLSLAGYVSAGLDIMSLARDPTWAVPVIMAAGVSAESGAFVRDSTPWALAGLAGLIALPFAARFARDAWRRRLQTPRLFYPDGRVVAVVPGSTVLEASRAAGIPHAAVCGGRGRCSTCRVRIDIGADTLPPPGPDETKVLTRIRAGQGVRLACQVRPTADLSVAPLLPPTAPPREGFARSATQEGREMEIAILFADLRGFTRLSEGKLPFDTVFLLNRYFAVMGHEIEEAGGRVDKFIGDGIMALFGVDQSPFEAGRSALQAARGMAGALDRLNQGLAADLPQPLRMGIGLHLGPVIVGEMGYGPVKSLTAIGDAVNIASRLEGLTKEFGVQLIVSDRLARRCLVDLTSLEERNVAIRGRRDSLPVRLIPDASALTVTGEGH